MSEDAKRLDYLTELRRDSQLDPVLAAELDRMIAFIEQWTRGKDLWKFFYMPILETEDFDFGVRTDSPLAPLGQFYRARMLIWVTLEYENRWREPEPRRKRFAMIRDILEQVHRSFPENRIVRMYLGEPISPRVDYAAVPGAPEWAVYQREALERLRDIIVWWIDHRLQENGEYGGDLGDDCEMWRWWEPVLVGFDDPKITKAQEFFSRSLLNRDYVKKGYSDRLWDVQHTSEETSDGLTPMMLLDPTNDEWSDRALRLAELMESVWTGVNGRGTLQFKSTFVSASEVGSDPQAACDTLYHTSAIQPLLLYWQRTRDERIGRLVSSWMDTWVDAAAREERGKSAGILPSAIHWPDGGIGGLGEHWCDPQCYPGGDQTLYRWPSALDQMTHTLLATYHMTGREKYLDPIRSMARIRMEYLKNPPATAPAEGSLAWCASKLGRENRHGNLSGVLAKYRSVTGSKEFDELLLADASPYVKYRMVGDSNALTMALRNIAEAFSFNFEGYTSEVRFTDRVLRLPPLFGENGLCLKAVEAIHVPDPALLYAAVTGDPGGSGSGWFPLNAVRWRTPPRGIAALVTDCGARRFEAELFHFGEKPRVLKAEFFLLEPGDYTVTLAAEGGTQQGEVLKGNLTVTATAKTVDIELPPRQLCHLRILPTGT